MTNFLSLLHTPNTVCAFFCFKLIANLSIKLRKGEKCNFTHYQLSVQKAIHTRYIECAKRIGYNT